MRRQTVFVLGLVLVGCSVRLGGDRPFKIPDRDIATSDIPARREFPLSQTTKPCDNFYQHVCEVAVSRFKLRPDRNRHIFSINDSDERILAAKMKFLSELGAKTGLSPRTEQLKTVYAACMDIGARQREERSLVKSLVEQVTKIEKREELLDLLAARVVSGEPSFLALDTEANLAQPGFLDLILQPTLMALPSKGYYQNPSLMKAYESVVAGFFGAIGSENPAREARKVVALEAAFAATQPDRSEIRQRAVQASRAVSPQSFRKEYPALELASLFAKVPADTQIRNFYPESLQFLNRTLQDEPLETLKSLYLYRVLSTALMDAYPAYFEQRRAFLHQYVAGPPRLPERSERCTKTVMSQFDKEIDIELLPVLFPDFSKARFEGLVRRVRAAIIQRLQTNTWLTPMGKQGALRKLHAARLQLASPDSEKEWDFLQVAQFHPETPIGNQWYRSSIGIRKLLSELGRARNRQAWNMGPLTVNAFYDPSDNRFMMLQGILQYPFYDSTMSDAATLGAVGMVVGHELGHGFDDLGSQYNQNGALEEWMPEADRKKFRELTRILVQQFNAAVDPKINDRYGEQTLGENIADVSGLSFAFEAAFPQGGGSVQDKQDFYVQAARVWCGTMLPGEYEKRVRTDEHAQTETRVNEPLKHQPGFYEAFGCKAGDKMYLPPAKRMDLW